MCPFSAFRTSCRSVSRSIGVYVRWLFSLSRSVCYRRFVTVGRSVGLSVCHGRSVGLSVGHSRFVGVLVGHSRFVGGSQSVCRSRSFCSVLCDSSRSVRGTQSVGRGVPPLVGRSRSFCVTAVGRSVSLSVYLYVTVGWCVTNSGKARLQQSLPHHTTPHRIAPHRNTNSLLDFDFDFFSHFFRIFFAFFTYNVKLYTVHVELV